MTPPLPLLRVLGTPALFGPDGEPVTFRTKKHFALLIYLVLEPRVHRREQLAALLWPRATTAEARHSLSTALSVLRAKLGREGVETSRDTARLIPGTLELDLDRLARGEIHATDTTEALQIAPLIHDFPISDAVPWEQWRDGLAAKWRPAIRDALLSRIDRMRRQGNTRAMEVLADALIALDDLSEDGIRAKMESRAFAGDRLTALQIYEDWRVRLGDELGAQPSDLVAGMATRLRRRGWERTNEEHIPAVRTDQWKDRPFVGRAKEYEVLYEGWEGCQRGTPRHTLITGESGVGKSTLMERLTTAAGLQGATAVRVQCHVVEREIPYGAIGALIGLLLDRPGASTVSPEWLSELSRTVGAVRRRFQNVAAPAEVTGEMVRIHLADAFHELVRAIAEEQPLILVMDDIHLGDDASVAVMHLLLRRLTNERVQVMCTLRHEEGALAPSARGMLERAELAQMTVLPLPPLSLTESSELLDQLISDQNEAPPPTVRRALLRAGSGLPMLMELLVRDWKGHGDRCVALAVQAMTEEPGAAGGAGETYRRLLERLTLGLDAGARSVLNLSAILGSQLNEFDLYALVDVSLAQAMAGLSHLATLRILRDSGLGLEFVNEVMRGEVYLAVPSSVRKVLHSKVADRLIQRSQDGEEMLGLAIAWHCMRSGRVQEAGEWLVVGGKEAIERSALAEAEEALESGFRNLPNEASLTCGGLLLDVLMDQSRYGDAQPLAASIAARSAGIDFPRVMLSVQLARLSLGIHNPASHATTLEGLVAFIEACPDDSLRLRAAALGTSLAAEVLDDDTFEHMLSVVRRAAACGTAQQEYRYELLVAQLRFWQRRLDDVETTLNRLSRAVHADGQNRLKHNLQMGLAICHTSRGNYAAAIEPLKAAIALAARAGSPGGECNGYSNLALVHYRLGEFESAHMAASRARSIPYENAHGSARVGATGILLCCSALRQGWRELERLMANIRHQAAHPEVPRIAQLLSLWAADAMFLAGQRESAIAFAEEAFQSTQTPPIAWYGLPCRWAGQLAASGRRNALEALMPRALGIIDRLDVLDQLEVAAVSLEHCELTLESRSKLQLIARKAESALPRSTVGQLKRLGLRMPHQSAI